MTDYAPGEEGDRTGARPFGDDGGDHSMWLAAKDVGEEIAELGEEERREKSINGIVAEVLRRREEYRGGGGEEVVER